MNRGEDPSRWRHAQDPIGPHGDGVGGGGWGVSDAIEFWVDGLPKAQPRPRACARNGHVSVYDPGTATEWKKCIEHAGRPHAPVLPHDGPVGLRIWFAMPRPKSHYRAGGGLRDDAPTRHLAKPDLDNLEKAVMDTLTKIGFWRDDSLVCSKETHKVYGERPGCSIKVYGMVVTP